MPPDRKVRRASVMAKRTNVTNEPETHRKVSRNKMVIQYNMVEAIICFGDSKMQRITSTTECPF